jgi:hypothetical protein
LSFTHHFQRQMRLVLLKSVQGTNSCYHYNHLVNGGFFMHELMGKGINCRGRIQQST